MEREQHSNMRVLFLLEDPVFTADVETPQIDMAETTLTEADAGNLAETLEYIVSIGAIATVGGSIDCRAQESDDGSVWNNVPNDEVIGGTDLATEVQSGGEAVKGLVIPIGAQNASFRLGTISKKQFQRLALTEEAAVTAGP